MNPVNILEEGARILGTVLAPAGFEFTLTASGIGSGGPFASGRFSRNNRELDLHYRYSLGLVTYRIGAAELDHVTYMRYAGVYGQNLYPGFSNEPVAAFGHLAHDLQHFCGDFVAGSGQEFASFAQQHRLNPRRFSGIAATSP